MEGGRGGGGREVSRVTRSPGEKVAIGIGRGIGIAVFGKPAKAMLGVIVLKVPQKSWFDWVFRGRYFFLG